MASPMDDVSSHRTEDDGAQQTSWLGRIIEIICGIAKTRISFLWIFYSVYIDLRVFSFQYDL